MTMNELSSDSSTTANPHCANFDSKWPPENIPTPAAGLVAEREGKIRPSEGPGAKAKPSNQLIPQN